MNPYSVLLRPLLSEKSNSLREKQNKYCFKVSLEATKLDVAKAVEKVFEVKVVDVQTLVTRGKIRRRGNQESKASNTKKAIVTLAKDQKLKLFEDA